MLVTCEVTIFGLGSHSATGEEWADNDNAGTAAEAQAFKRACACFGLGRYLYCFTGTWVDLDDRKRWDDFTDAYRGILKHTSTKWAPWFVVPADDKHVRDWLIARAIADRMDKLHLRYPAADSSIVGLKID